MPPRLRLSVRPVRAGENRVEWLLLSWHGRREAPSGALERDAAPALAEVAVAQASEVIALYRPDGRCLLVGGGVTGVLGYTREEWMELVPCDLLHPADLEAYRESLDPEALASQSRPLLLRVRTRGGEHVSMEVAARLVEHAAEGTIVHVTARDVTQERRAEEALRWLSRQTRLILDSAGEGIFGLDVRGTVTFANPAAARMLGYPASELLGRSYRQFVETAAGVGGDEIGDTLADGLLRVVEAATFRGGEGSPIVVEYTCNPARQDGMVVGAVVTFRDVSARRRGEASVRRAQWRTGVAQTVRTLRHEINNPLTSLLAEAALLEMGGNTPEEEREMVLSIVAQGRRIRDIVQRLAELHENPDIRLDSDGSMLDLSGE